MHCSDDVVLEEGRHSIGAKTELALLNNGVKEDLDILDQSRQQIRPQSGGLRNKNERLLDNGVKEDLDTGDQSTQQIRPQRKQNERKMRQKQKEKMKILQELIPNCNKRDRSSILDDAIKYIKLLQYQIQMMSIGAYYSTFHSPMMMGQQEMQTCPQRGSSNTGEMEYEIGTRIPGMFAPFKSPMSQAGLHNPYFVSSLTTSRLPFESLSNTAPSYMDWMPFYYTPSSGPEPTTLQGPMGKQSFTWMESTTRVLPSKVVQSHLTKEVMDCGSSNSASNEWPHSSTARKPEEHRFPNE